MKSREVKNTLRQMTMGTQPYKIYQMQQKKSLERKIIAIQTFLKNQEKSQTT